MRLRDSKGRFRAKRTGLGIKALVIPLIGLVSLHASIAIAKAIDSVEPEPVVVEMEEHKGIEVEYITKIDWTPERIEKEIRDTFVEDPDVAVAVAKAESELNAKAYNGEAHNGCAGSFGIMQIACVHESNPQKLYDVKYNVQLAYKLWKEQGWSPWGAYTDQRYKQFLY